jgi:hypothetical protein
VNKWNSITEVKINTKESAEPKLKITASTHDGNVPENTFR